MNAKTHNEVRPKWKRAALDGAALEVWLYIVADELLAWVVRKGGVYQAWQRPAKLDHARGCNLVRDGVWIGVYPSLGGAQAAAQATILGYR